MDWSKQLQDSDGKIRLDYTVKNCQFWAKILIL